MADTATERIDPNMRAFSGSRNGCAGSSGDKRLQFLAGRDGEQPPDSAQSRRSLARQLRTTAPTKVRA